MIAIRSVKHQRVATERASAGAFERSESTSHTASPDQEQSQEASAMIDTRLKMLSHSSAALLHSCPRKYQLTKLIPHEKEESIHLAFGSAFGEGIQRLLCKDSLQDATIRAVAEWSMSVFEDSVPDKTLWRCLAALELFHDRLTNPLAQLEGSMGLGVETEDGMDMEQLTPNIMYDYEVAMYQGQYAAELGFAIELPEGFVYRGYVDLVLQHKDTKAPLVVDIKSTAAKYTNSAKFQNSPQCLGYSIVVDAVMGQDCGEFGVLYYEYMTGLRKYISHYFILGTLSRAKWLHNLMMDTRLVKLYSTSSEFPMHGESCVSFNRTCVFLSTCTISTNSLLGEDWQPDTRPWQEVEASYGTRKPIHIYVNIAELIQRQLAHIQAQSL